MRILAAWLVLLGGSAQAAVFSQAIDLTDPGALRALRVERPEHYAKAQAILAIARAGRQPNVERWIAARFDASDVEMIAWRVSYPAKLRVSFTLDTTRYSADVVPDLSPPRAVPLR